MPRSQRNASAVESPWWMTGGEYCDHCLQEYTLNLEFYCVECDRPICPLCAIVVTETRQIICPECETHSHRDREEF